MGRQMEFAYFLPVQYTLTWLREVTIFKIASEFWTCNKLFWSYYLSLYHIWYIIHLEINSFEEKWLRYLEYNLRHKKCFNAREAQSGSQIGLLFKVMNCEILWESRLSTLRLTCFVSLEKPPSPSIARFTHLSSKGNELDQWISNMYIQWTLFTNDMLI